jgi:Tfp pilus assembly protein PilF
VKKAYNEIATEVAEATALNQLILAGFYEENNLIIDAIAAYEQAIKLAPDVTSYQEAYDDFLLRQGLRTK